MELPAKSQSSSCRCRYKSGMLWAWALQWLALVRTWLWCAVIGSGAHVTMVAMVDNASGICKAFMKYFINSIIVVQTNATLHTLEQCSSHIETLRSVWSWSAEIFEAHIHRQTDTHTQAEIPFFYREIILENRLYVMQTQGQKRYT